MLELTDKGLYCAQADVYIDPIRKVSKAIITHGHSDHAYKGMENYLCHEHSYHILKYRLGTSIKIETKKYGESFFMNGVKISLHPAGHIIGSAQVRLEYKGKVWVVSGDYKFANDGFTPAMEILPCNVFISESTFALPLYQFEIAESINKKILAWVANNKKMGIHSVFLVYPLGKAQRLMHVLGQDNNEIFVQSSVALMNKAIELVGFTLPEFKEAQMQNVLEIKSPSCFLLSPNLQEGRLIKKLQPFQSAICSGWVLGGKFTQRGIDHGFAMSDHADWNELNYVIKNTGAEQVLLTHGFSHDMAQWLRESNKIDAQVLNLKRQNEPEE